MKQVKVIRYSISDYIFIAVDWCILSLFLLIIAYPLLYVISASFSGSISIMGVSLIPKSFSLAGYEAVFKYKDIWVGYINSLYYMIVGTGFSLIVTISCAYPLSRDDLIGSKYIMGVCVFTMYFSGGLIPTYLLVQKLNLLDTVWSIVLTGAMSVYYMIVMRTYFKTQIPSELLEASQLDGCGNIRFLNSIVLPLSKPILAVIGLFYAVSYWNSYFSAMIYLTTRFKYPLQIFLREILILNTADPSSSKTITTDPDLIVKLEERKNVMKYAVIIVSSLPVMLLYPFVQKYFIKGIMIGSIKG